MGRFDYHAEAALRLSRPGCSGEPAAPMRCFTPGEDGVSHFNHWRDNLLLTSMFCHCWQVA
jgi:hypothetical protein